MVAGWSGMTCIGTTIWLYDDPVKPPVADHQAAPSTISDTVTTDAGPERATDAYRGFLFSDIRGFTAFAEQYGNAAAAERVAHFLELARTAIAQHEGAEIKTEGDAIHAVFPSASMAVMCGLEIVESAAGLEQQADRPLDLGVGVHAGEAVETDEGYIGTAVNIAARLCAAALPGEVLVSSTVKSMVGDGSAT